MNRQDVSRYDRRSTIEQVVMYRLNNDSGIPIAVVNCNLHPYKICLSEYSRLVATFGKYYPKYLKVFEINLNPQFADLLQHHGINVSIDEEFIHTDLPDNIKFKARAVYQEVNGNISSRLDAMVLTGKGEQIIECFSDFGATIEEAVNRNFQNFSTGSLHPLLASLGCNDPHTYDQVTIEEWKVNDKNWTAYIGNLIPKILDDGHCVVTPPVQFFESVEKGIYAQKPVNRIHWFRSYYAQWNNEIIEREFLMDNEPVNGTEQIFSTLPIIPGVKFYSCRNFIVLKNKDSI